MPVLLPLVMKSIKIPFFPPLGVLAPVTSNFVIFGTVSFQTQKLAYSESPDPLDKNSRLICLL